MTEPSDSENKESKRKLKHIIIILVISIIVVAVAFIFGGGLPGFSVFTPMNPSTPQGVGLVVDPNAADDKYIAPPKEAEPGVAIPGFSKLTVPAYTTDVIGINLHNPEANEGNYYLTYTLSLLDENGKVSETLYESQLLPPGQYLQNINLSRGLEPGEYPAVMHVQPYRIADTTKTNSANLKLTIIVK